MRVEVSQASLHAALQRLSPALSSKPVTPILGSILLWADDDGLSVRGGGGGITVEARLDAASGEAVVHRTGQLLVPSRSLLPVIRCLPPGSVALESVHGPALLIRAGHARYRLSGLDAGQYPYIAVPPHTHELHFTNARLKEIIRRLAFAASSSEARPILTGISCSIDAGSIAFTATDGVRLSSQRISRTPLAETPSALRTAVIPAKPWLDFVNLLDDEGSTAMTLGTASVRFQTNELWLQLALLEGSYPVLDRVAAQECETTITLMAPDLLRALERVTLLAGEHRAVKLASDRDGLAVALTARTEGIGDVEESVPAQSVDGQPLTIAFNGSYLRDFMRAASGSAVTLTFSTPNKPIVIRTTDEPSSLFVLTPIRTAGAAP
ncbi:DNA polymerase III subunit beta [Paenibacillus rhizovicinus]|uniref:Beta sliding clamp n=1 Tax=Paenibacillus rhizovicinus TaxID=2704463 RepID=A0A6C0P2A8_9BACL|nr:DNA polymerase III subunit beta [Paenibacillus rhizovicinus]QHW32396.1 DNA polymerase III subunit beta [Paenibacillus rhizovicinus]